MSPEAIVCKPIGFVSSARTDLRDDNWGSVESTIIIDAAQFSEDGLLGLDAFSHIEVVYYFHRVLEETILHGARHPRNQVDWPRVGILSQRAKARPNRLGVSRCRLLSINGLELRVMSLDAVDGSPVLDIKPYFAEFGPIGKIRQPPWSHGIMVDYYR